MAATHGLRFKYQAPDKSELKKFGLMVGTVFILLAGIALWHQKPAGKYLAAVGLYLVLGAAISSVLLRPAHVFWMALSHYLGLVSNTLVLGFFYYVVLFPVGFFVRHFSKIHYSKTGGWKEKANIIDYNRQF